MVISYRYQKRKGRMQVIRFLVNVPAELHRALKEKAGAQGQTLNGLVRQILWDWVRASEREH